MPRLFGRFLGSTVSGAASYSVGSATARSLDPLLQDLTNSRWASHPAIPLDIGILAEGVVTGELTYEHAQHQAEFSGYNKDRFDDLIQVMDNGPGVAQAFRLWRRGRIDEAGFRRALKRTGLEQEWINRLAETKTEPLDVAVIANAIQQGFIPSDGILAGDAGGTAPFTPPVEQVNVNGIEEAEWAGVPSDHLKVLAQLSGNPPGPQTLLEMWRKGIITEEAVNRGLREGRTKTKWTSAIKANRFALLTAIQTVNLWLRGWIDRGEALPHLHKLGYTDDLADLLYKGQGRPLSMRQAYIGHERGGVYDGPTGDIPDYFLLALRQSSIRPEWYNLAWAQRHTLPSAFVLRSLTQAGDILRADAEGLLKDSGWPHDLAEKVARAWATGGGDAGRELTATQLREEFEGHLIGPDEYRRELAELGYTPEAVTEMVRLAGSSLRRKARKQRIDRIHLSYVNHKIQRPEAVRELGEAGITADQVELVMEEWDNERQVNPARLTPAQIKATWKKTIFSLPEAIDRLELLGYETDDAYRFLGLRPGGTEEVMSETQILAAYQRHAISLAEAIRRLEALGKTTAEAYAFLGVTPP